MCIYSAEGGPQRHAKVDDQLIVKQVHPGIAGLFEESPRGLLVCISCGSTLALSGIPKRVRKKYHLNRTEMVITSERPMGSHKHHVDVVQFVSKPGLFLTFSQLGPDCTRAEVRVLGKANLLEGSVETSIPIVVPTEQVIQQPIRPQIIMSPNRIEMVSAEALMAPPAHHSDFAGRRRELALSEH